MPRARVAGFAILTAAILAFSLLSAAAGSVWAGSAGEATRKKHFMHVAPLDPRHGKHNGLRVEPVEDLRFGKVVAGIGHGGKVVLDPATGRKTAHGGAYDLGGHHSRAEFMVRGKPNSRFAILLPDKIRLSGKGGEVVLRKLTSSPDHYGRIGPSGGATVYVGATLKLSRDQPTGEFRGSFGVLLDPR